MRKRVKTRGMKQFICMAGLSAAVLAMPFTAAVAEGMSQDDAMKLARKSGCLICHKIEVKVMGPAWKDVAAKYQGDEGARAMLLEKVRKGGKGNWTEVTHGITMPPSPKRVTDEDIANLVDFILSL